ncbi:MAG: hypothetical protein KY455_04995 [Euryarchaeota archaeon]|nr:hypothetical protein [Euryarchaeota archaeon]
MTHRTATTPHAPRHVRRAPALVILALVLVVPFVALPSAGHHGTSAPHDLVRVRIIEDPTNGTNLLELGFHGTLRVQDDAEGRHLRVVLPHDVEVIAFAPENGTAPGRVTTTTEGGEPVARYFFPDDAPAAGTAVEEVRLHARRTIDDKANVPLDWKRPGSGVLFVEVRGTESYALSQDLGLVQQVHGRSGARDHAWILSNLTAPRLEMTFRYIPDGPEAAHAVPPLPGLGWLALLALAALAGGVWYLGFRSERGEGP